MGEVAQPLSWSRSEALGWLQQRIAEGRCGLDPHDRTLLILEVHYLAARAAQWLAAQTGDLVDARIHTAANGTLNTRVRFRPDQQARWILNLDRPDAPVITDEPLASRAVSTPAVESTERSDRVATNLRRSRA